jgi:serine/threonine-protein kinase
MECLAGHTLHDELQRGALTEDRAGFVARDVLAGLAAAHELGIIHRDISPSNILLTDDGRAKIADFGIAKTAEGMDHTMVGQVLGTPAYLAPERLRGEPATPASDIYALGVTLYEAVTGERPFKGDTPVAVAQSVLSTPPTPLAELRPEFDRDLADTIDTAMSTDPELRPSATALLATAEGRDEEEPPTAPVTTVSLAAEPAMATVAASVITDMPAPVADRDKRERRLVLVGIATVAVIGALLLGLANANSHDAAGTSTEPTTVTAPPPTTVTTAAPVVVRARVPAVTKNLDGGGKRKGKAGKR